MYEPEKCNRKDDSSNWNEQGDSNEDKKEEDVNN